MTTRLPLLLGLLFAACTSSHRGDDYGEAFCRALLQDDPETLCVFGTECAEAAIPIGDTRCMDEQAALRAVEEEPMYSECLGACPQGGVCRSLIGGEPFMFPDCSCQAECLRATPDGAYREARLALIDCFYAQPELQAAPCGF